MGWNSDYRVCKSHQFLWRRKHGTLLAPLKRCYYYYYYYYRRCGNNGNTFVRVIDAVVDRVVDKLAGDAALIGTAIRQGDVTAVSFCQRHVHCSTRTHIAHSTAASIHAVHPCVGDHELLTPFLKWPPSSHRDDGIPADSDLSRPPGGGGYNPQFSCDIPQPSEVQRGLSGGVYGGCLCDRDGRVKYWHEPIYLLYETNNAQNLVNLLPGILLKLLPPDVIFCS